MTARPTLLHPCPSPFPQVGTWLLRLATDPLLARGLKDDAVAFATWYALIGASLDWPPEVQRIQEAERCKHLPLELQPRLEQLEIECQLKGESARAAGRISVR